jgi:predicted Zn-dependent protease
VTDHYAALGVARTASSAEIRQAYLRLAREHHPDRFQDPGERARAQQQFQAISEAFNTLSSDERRRQYDAQISKPRLETPEEIAQDAFAKARAKLEARDYAGAVELINIAIHHAPREASYQVALGRILARTVDRVREAAQCFERALELDPKSVPVHLELARLLLDQGLKLRARKVLEAARGLAPSNAEVARLLAEAGGGPAEPEPKKQAGGLGGLFGRRR